MILKLVLFTCLLALTACTSSPNGVPVETQDTEWTSQRSDDAGYVSVYQGTNHPDTNNPRIMQFICTADGSMAVYFTLGVNVTVHAIYSTTVETADRDLVNLPAIGNNNLVRLLPPETEQVARYIRSRESNQADMFFSIADTSGGTQDLMFSPEGFTEAFKEGCGWHPLYDKHEV